MKPLQRQTNTVFESDGAVSHLHSRIHREYRLQEYPDRYAYRLFGS
jgi:hypothetical protein